MGARNAAKPTNFGFTIADIAAAEGLTPHRKAVLAASLLALTDDDDNDVSIVAGVFMLGQTAGAAEIGSLERVNRRLSAEGLPCIAVDHFLTEGAHDG